MSEGICSSLWWFGGLGYAEPKQRSQKKRKNALVYHSETNS